MTTSITTRFLAFATIAAFTVLSFSDSALAQRRGGGRGGGTPPKTSRKGPASRGSVKKAPKASSPKKNDARDNRKDRRDDARDNRKDRRDDADDRRDDRRDDAKDTRKTVRRTRWVRRRNGRRIAAASWTLECTDSETVDGVTYRYCGGSWWEKVMDGDEVYWVEVDKP